MSINVDALKALERVEVLVGFPADGAPREDGAAISNAQLAFIQENGSPANNIPPRPFLNPGIRRGAKRLAKIQAMAIKAALTGKPVEPIAELLGQQAVTEVQNFLKDSSNGLAPNAPATIKQKGSDKPLIDTASMFQGIKYVVRNA